MNHTIWNVEIDFPLGSFFRENITQYGDGGDVVWPEVTLPFAKITNSEKAHVWFQVDENTNIHAVKCNPRGEESYCDCVLVFTSRWLQDASQEKCCGNRKWCSLLLVFSQAPLADRRPPRSGSQQNWTVPPDWACSWAWVTNTDILSYDATALNL